VRWGIVEGVVDGREHALEIVEHVIVSETEDTVAVLRELVGATVIGVFIGRVLAAIELDGNLCLRAGEIDDVPPDRMLAAKFPFAELFAQSVPHEALDVRRIAAETPRDPGSRS